MLVNLVFFFFVILSETKDLIIIARFFANAQTVYRLSGNDRRDKKKTG